MQTDQRKFFAIILIIIGIAAFLLGAWLLYGLLFGGDEQGGGPNLPEAGTDLSVTGREVPEPQTFEAPVVVEGESTFDSTATGSDITEARNLAADTVARIGSGTSQNGFLGYEDAMSAATPKMRSYLASKQLEMQQFHPKDGELHGITTRVIASKVLEGGNGDNTIIIEIQTQKAVDNGDRAKPVEVIYEKHEVTLVRQEGGKYLVDYISTELLD